MNHTGECHGNTQMENFVARIKVKRVSRRRHRYRDDTRADIVDYFAWFGEYATRDTSV